MKKKWTTNGNKEMEMVNANSNQTAKQSPRVLRSDKNHILVKYDCKCGQYNHDKACKDANHPVLPN